MIRKSFFCLAGVSNSCKVSWNVTHSKSQKAGRKRKTSVERKMSVEPPVITFDASVTAGRNGLGEQTGHWNDPKSKKQQSKEPGYCCLWGRVTGRPHTHRHRYMTSQIDYFSLIFAKVSTPACLELDPDSLAQVPSGLRNSVAKMSRWEEENITLVSMATWLDIQCLFTLCIHTHTHTRTKTKNSNWQSKY